MALLKQVVLLLSMIFISLVDAPVYAGSIPKEDVESAIIEHLSKTCNVTDMELEFSVPRVVSITVPECDAPQITVTHEPVAMPVRMIPVTITVAAENGEVIRNLRQTVRLRFFTHAVVANTDIRLGEELRPDMFTINRVDVTGVDDYFTSISYLDGLQTKKFLRQGAVVSANMVRPAFLVDRGDKVAVEVHDGAFSIRTEGTARQGGSLGEKISVYLDMTKTTVSGIVINEETVLTGANGG